MNFNQILQVFFFSFINKFYCFSFIIDTERVYGYIRMFTGDEMSKRAKFALITWIGSGVNALKRARTSIDKSVVKDVITVCFSFIYFF